MARNFVNFLCAGAVLQYRCAHAHETKQATGTSSSTAVSLYLICSSSLAPPFSTAPVTFKAPLHTMSMFASCCSDMSLLSLLACRPLHLPATFNLHFLLMEATLTMPPCQKITDTKVSRRGGLQKLGFSLPSKIPGADTS